MRSVAWAMGLASVKDLRKSGSGDFGVVGAAIHCEVAGRVGVWAGVVVAARSVAVRKIVGVVSLRTVAPVKEMISVMLIDES